VLHSHPDDSIVNLDKLTYAGNPANLADIEADPDLGARYRFVHGDICDPAAVDAAIARFADWGGAVPGAIVNFAAETHVDRSISGPEAFIRTDVIGTHVLLEALRAHGISRYLQISTDEVYGSIESGSFLETDPLSPSSPYSASKAGADLLVLAYRTTYDAPVLITRSANNYGPYQYPEKLIPLFATNALDEQPLPLYGDGGNVRDWIHVEDNCRALDAVLRHGELGQIYNVGAGNEVSNREITARILAATGRAESLIRRVPDRLGHDRRYSVDCARLRALGWAPQVPFVEGLQATVDWYAERRDWWAPIKSGEWRAYYEAQYGTLEPSS
jgi:dTDP-glucose 4,6-dehydratase